MYPYSGASIKLSGYLGHPGVEHYIRLLLLLSSPVHQPRIHVPLSIHPLPIPLQCRGSAEENKTPRFWRKKKRPISLFTQGHERKTPFSDRELQHIGSAATEPSVLCPVLLGQPAFQLHTLRRTAPWQVASSYTLPHKRTSGWEFQAKTQSIHFIYFIFIFFDGSVSVLLLWVILLLQR